MTKNITIANHANILNSSISLHLNFRLAYFTRHKTHREDVPDLEESKSSSSAMWSVVSLSLGKLLLRLIFGVTLCYRIEQHWKWTKETGIRPLVQKSTITVLGFRIKFYGSWLA